MPLSFPLFLFFYQLLFFRTILVECVYHPKAGGPCRGWLWMEMVQFYCTGAKQQQKKKMGKKDTKKRKKKASLGMGQSVLWRLLTHLGALFLLTV